MVMDGLKKQTLGKFRQKLCDAGCERKITEPFSPWQNAAEHKIKELKKPMVGSYYLPIHPEDSGTTA